MDDLDWTSSLPARSRGRFDHTDPGDRPLAPPPRRAPNEHDADEPLDFDAERAALEDPPARRSRRAADADRAAATATAPLAPPPARRTVQITGRTVAARRFRAWSRSSAAGRLGAPPSGSGRARTASRSGRSSWSSS